MKVRILITLCFALCSGLNLLAQAQEVINEPHVPLNVQKHYFKGDEEIQITSPDRHIVDLRHQKSINNLTIMISPAPAPKITNTIIKLPEVSGFQSNIPATSNIPTSNNLPKLAPGQNYRLLSNTNKLKPGDLLAQHSLSLTGKSLSPPATPAPQIEVLKYNQTDNHFTTHSNLRVNTAVSGKLKSKPGALLNSQ